MYIFWLLRIMFLKMFNSLWVYYLVVGDKVRENYFLFGLFFDFNDNLFFVLNLIYFVFWSWSVDLLLSRCFSCKDISIKIGDVIWGKVNFLEEKKWLIEVFENFIIVFEEMYFVLKDCF